MFSTALCPRQSKMVLRIERKWKMMCSSDGSNSISFLCQSFSSCELPVESPMQMGGGISAVTRKFNSHSCSGNGCRAGLSKFNFFFFPCRTKTL